MSERGYLDGVPMRLNSKFYPQPRPQFKEIDIHIPIDALQDDYDFSLERHVLIEVSAWQEQKRLDDERKAEEAKRKAEEEERKQIEAEQKRLEDDERRRREEEEHRRQEEERKLVEEEERRQLEEETKRKLEEEQLKKWEEEAELRKTLEEERLKKLKEEVETRKTLEEERLIKMAVEAETRKTLEVERIKEAETRKTQEGNEKDVKVVSSEVKALSISEPESNCRKDNRNSAEASPSPETENGDSSTATLSKNSSSAGNSPVSCDENVTSSCSQAIPVVPNNQNIQGYGSSVSPSPMSQEASPRSSEFSTQHLFQPHSHPPSQSISNRDIQSLPTNPVNTSGPYYHRQAYVRNARINLSDFESDTANPFDNVELKSINEMEMLASVLKNNGSTVPPSQNLDYRSDPHIANTNYINGAPSAYGNHGPPQTASSCLNPGSYNGSNAYAAQQWNTNSSYYVPASSPSAPDIPVRLNTPVTAPTPMASQSNIPASTANSFTKYYFPLLTSMADTRSLRDRQNQFSNNLNHGYSQPLPNSGISTNSPSGSSANQNPFLSTSHSNSTIQQFPILGSLSQQPSASPHYWPNGASMALQNTYNISNNPSPNGSLANDPLHKSNNSHSPASADLSASTSNGTTQHTLR